MAPLTLEVADAARHQNNFNVVRILAAVSVIFGHAFPIMGATPDPTSLFFGPARHYIGDAAVDVFFVTSGFLLAMSAARGEPIWRFALNRVLRIYPALIVCNLVVVLVCWAVFNGFALSYFYQPQTVRYLGLNSLMLYPTAEGFAQNAWLPNSFTNVRIGLANGTLWTLAAEILAYLYMIVAMALAAALFGKKWVQLGPAIWGTMLALCLVWFEYLPFVGGEPMYKRLFLFFFTGAALYSARRFIALDWRYAAIVALGLWVIKAEFPAHYTIATHLAYPYLALFAAYGLPYSKPLNSAGDFSYGLYIYGWFVQNLVASLSGMTISPLTNFVVSSVIATALAVASWFWVEKPMLRLKGRTIRVSDASAPAPLVSAGNS